MTDLLAWLCAVAIWGTIAAIIWAAWPYAVARRAEARLILLTVTLPIPCGLWYLWRGLNVRAALAARQRWLRWQEHGQRTLWRRAQGRRYWAWVLDHGLPEERHLATAMLAYYDDPALSGPSR